MRDFDPGLTSRKDAIVLCICIDFDVVNDYLCHLRRFRIGVDFRTIVAIVLFCFEAVGTTAASYLPTLCLANFARQRVDGSIECLTALVCTCQSFAFAFSTALNVLFELRSEFIDCCLHRPSRTVR